MKKELTILVLAIFLISGCAEKIVENPKEETPTEQPKACHNEGEFCGGIAGIICCEGLTCQYEGDYPDAGGKCTEGIVKKIVPEETPKEEIKENIVDGKTLEERLDILESHLHTEGSGAEAKKLFPDFEKIYTDYNKDPMFSSVSPFNYYYSKEADITVSICGLDYTVFICDGKIDRLIKETDYNNCKITDAYLHPEKYAS